MGSGTYIREILVESTNKLLKINQHSVGGVNCVVWDAGLVLAKYLDHCYCKDDTYLKNKTVVDLGSGTGIVGLFAAALGANVILTDLPEASSLLKSNIRNNLSALIGSVVTAEHRWGEDIAEIPSPDLILVADCVYYESAVMSLVKTVFALKGPSTEVLISYEERTEGNKSQLIKAFLNQMKNVFTVKEIPESAQHPQFQSPDIHLLKCSCK